MHQRVNTSQVATRNQVLQEGGTLPNISQERKRYLPDDLKQHSMGKLRTSNGKRGDAEHDDLGRSATTKVVTGRAPTKRIDVMTLASDIYN